MSSRPGYLIDTYRTKKACAFKYIQEAAVFVDNVPKDADRKQLAEAGRWLHLKGKNYQVSETKAHSESLPLSCSGI